MKPYFRMLTPLYSFVLLILTVISSDYTHTSWFRNSTLLKQLCTDPTENTVSQQFVGVFTAPLPRNGRPMVHGTLLREYVRRPVA
jgi:hypothetical protein